MKQQLFFKYEVLHTARLDNPMIPELYEIRKSFLLKDQGLFLIMRKDQRLKGIKDSRNIIGSE